MDTMIISTDQLKDILRIQVLVCADIVKKFEFCNALSKDASDLPSPSDRPDLWTAEGAELYEYIKSASIEAAMNMALEVASS